MLMFIEKFCVYIQGEYWLLFVCFFFLDVFKVLWVPGL